MANGNSGCGTLLVLLVAIWAVGKCSESTSPTPRYEPPAVSRAYAPPLTSDAYYDAEGIDDLSDESFEQPDFETYADEAELSNDNYYANSRGETVHSPAYSPDGSVPDGATAVCRDGTYSFSRSRRGTCSHHGGVDYWL